MLEWSPPYNWREPTRPKEQSIDEAVRYVEQLFTGSLVGLVPVCSDAARQRTWGILEELIPALTGILNDAQSAALLQTFERDLNRDQLKTLLKQVGRMGSEPVPRLDRGTPAAGPNPEIGRLKKVGAAKQPRRQPPNLFAFSGIFL